MNESLNSNSRRSSFRKAIAIGLVFLGMVTFYRLQKTPALEISSPTLLRLVPAPGNGAVFAGAAHIPRLRRMGKTKPWSDVLDETLLELITARGVFPDGIAQLNNREMIRALGLMTGEAGIVDTGKEKLAVVELGIMGRIGYNLARWLGPIRGRALRVRLGETDGLALLPPGSENPYLYAAMRGSYLFASQTKEFLIASLAIGEGTNDRDSLEDRLEPLSVGTPRAQVTIACFGPERSPRLLTAELDSNGAKVCYRYVPQEELSLLPPEKLLEPAGSIPKSAGIYFSSVWPPALMASLSTRTKTLRDKTNAWLSWRTPDTPRILESELERPVTLAVADWIEVPGHLPFPNLVVLVRAKDADRAFDAFDRALRASLHGNFSRTETDEPESPIISFKNEGYLGTLAPSLTTRGDRILLASTPRFLQVSMGALEGHTPSLKDRPELAELEAFAGSKPLAAIAFAAGVDVAKLASDLLLKLASDLPSTAADDARDLLVPAVEKIALFDRIYGRLEVEEQSKTARFDLRLDLNDGPRRDN